MRQLIDHWILLCLLLGVAACGETVPSTPVSVVGKSAYPSVMSKQQLAVPDKSPSVESQTATSDELAMVRSPSSPQPKPRADQSLVIKPGVVSEITAEPVTEKLASKDKVTTLEVVEATAREKPFTEQNTDDVINNIIWKIQSEVTRKPKKPEAKVPEGQDPSLLTTL